MTKITSLRFPVLFAALIWCACGEPRPENKEVSTTTSSITASAPQTTHAPFTTGATEGALDTLLPTTFGFELNVDLPGYKLWRQRIGVSSLYTYVLVADLSEGAFAQSFTGKASGSDGPGPLPKVGPNPNFMKQKLDDFYTAAYDDAVAMFPAAWFDLTRDPTPLSFLVKQTGRVISAGNNMESEYDSFHIGFLCINNRSAYAEVIIYDKTTFDFTSLDRCDTVIGGLNPESADKHPYEYTGRIMAGVTGSKLYVLISPWITASNWLTDDGALQILGKFGARIAILLPGGNVAQAKGLNTNERGIQQITTFVSPISLTGPTAPADPIPNVLGIWPGFDSLKARSTP
jgi:hypothetical protein